MSQKPKARPSTGRKAKIKVSAAAIGAGMGGAKIEGGDRPIGRDSGYNVTGEHWRARCPCCGSDAFGIEDVGRERIRINRLCPCGHDAIVAELMRRGLWPDGTAVDEDRGLKPRPKIEKRPPEAKGVADTATGPFVKLRRAVLSSVAMAVLSPLARWVLIELLIEYARPRPRPEEPFVKPLTQLDRCGKRREAIMTALRELEALKLVEVVHGGFDKAHGQCLSNLYRLTFVGTGCSDAWRASEPDSDAPAARREAEQSAKAVVAEAEAKATGARKERDRRRTSRRIWAAPPPIPQPDEWAGWEPDEASWPSETLDAEMPDYDVAELPEDPNFGFSPSPGRELGAESGEGIAIKSPERGRDDGECGGDSGAADEAGQSGGAGMGEGRVIAFPANRRPPDAPDEVSAAAKRVVGIEHLISTSVWCGRTRADALAHLAKIRVIKLDPDWAFRPGYR